MVYIIGITINKGTEKMKTIKSNTGRKEVRISKDGSGMFRAVLVQFVNTGIDVGEQVLDFVSYKSEKRAINWANRELA